MKAMILAAGRGERLRPLTERVAKPMLIVGGDPLIVHQVRWLHRAGIREIVINLHHLGEQIERALGNGKDFGVRIRYSHEPEILDTGGGIRNALVHLAPGPFVIVNGDVWTNYRFDRLLRIQPSDGHLVLTPTPAHKEKADFHVEPGTDPLKVRRGSSDDDLTYCGIAVLHPALFEGSPEGPFPLTDLLFPAAAEGRLSGEIFAGAWIDIGTHDQLKEARRRADGLVPDPTR
ncbi:MAG: nucleotidyltransferase family protein [Gammaproteobacteria bacterium]|nr:nucleotidyltransferase family protein [Gammaproteobacteria bacterium]